MPVSLQRDHVFSHLANLDMNVRTDGACRDLLAQFSNISHVVSSARPMAMHPFLLLDLSSVCVPPLFKPVLGAASQWNQFFSANQRKGNATPTPNHIRCQVNFAWIASIIVGHGSRHSVPGSTELGTIVSCHVSLVMVSPKCRSRS